ncbi:MAG: DUF6520 family protein [Rickettsiales bacterium]|jgi:hypothetical protein|nr:DUF6520 family protein [Rickettsiales bacterium]
MKFKILVRATAFLIAFGFAFASSDSFAEEPVEEAPDCSGQSWCTYFTGGRRCGGEDCNVGRYGTCECVEIVAQCICNAGYEIFGDGEDCTCTAKCANTCQSSGTTACAIQNGAGTKQNTGGNNCTGNCTYGACTVSSCNNGYYKNGNVCTACTAPDGITLTNGSNPAIGMNIKSKNNGVNGRTDCYIEGNFNDSTGAFGITGTNCTY